MVLCAFGHKTSDQEESDWLVTYSLNLKCDLFHLLLVCVCTCVCVCGGGCIYMQAEIGQLGKPKWVTDMALCINQSKLMLTTG